MPASMMSAVAGWSAKVDGNSKAIARTGPIPGSTPTIVPTSTPTKHARRLPGVSATANPYSSPSMGPISARGSVGPQATRKGDAEENGEEVVRSLGAEHGGEQRHGPGRAQRAQQRGAEEERGQR